MAFINKLLVIFEVCRREFNALPQFSDVVNAAVRCRVNFNQVYCPPALDFHAIGTPVARLAAVCRAIEAIDRFGNYARGGGFAATARTGKQIGVRGMPAFDLVLNGFGDVLLADDVGKRLRPVFAIEYKIIHIFNVKCQIIDVKTIS